MNVSGKVSGNERLHHDRFQAMNTTIDLNFWGRDEQILKLIGRARDWFRYVEAKFSRFRPDSELSYINRCAGRHCLVSEAMLEALQLAEAYKRATGGIFNPFILKALKQAGYADTFDEIKNKSGSQNRMSAPSNDMKASPDFDMDLNPGMKSVLIPPDPKSIWEGSSKAGPFSVWRAGINEWMAFTRHH